MMTNRQLQMPEDEGEDADLEEVTSDIEATPRTVVDPMTATAQELDDLIKRGEKELQQPLLTMAATVNKDLQETKDAKAQADKENEIARRKDVIRVVTKLKEDIVESCVWKDTKKMTQRFKLLKDINHGCSRAFNPHIEYVKWRTARMINAQACAFTSSSTEDPVRSFTSSTSENGFTSPVI